MVVYDLLDLGIQKSDGEAGSASWRNGPANDAQSLEESKGSQPGFRGNEDLGGGRSAQFRIEHRFKPDTGAAAPTFWAGRSYVQLSSRTLGAVHLGREYTPCRNLAEAQDPFFAIGYGHPLSKRTHLYLDYARAARTGASAARRSGTTAWWRLACSTAPQPRARACRLHEKGPSPDGPRGQLKQLPPSGQRTRPSFQAVSSVS